MHPQFVARGAQVEQGGNPCQRMDLQKLLPGARNLPGVFPLLLGTFLRRFGIWGEGLVLDPPFGRETTQCKGFYHT